MTISKMPQVGDVCVYLPIPLRRHVVIRDDSFALIPLAEAVGCLHAFWVVGGHVERIGIRQYLVKAFPVVRIGKVENGLAFQAIGHENSAPAFLVRLNRTVADRQQGPETERIGKAGYSGELDVS